jgi:hypothetical protein
MASVPEDAEQADGATWERKAMRIAPASGSARTSQAVVSTV